MEEIYPKHIYDEIRRRIGVDYVQHELRKYLPNLRDKPAWKIIDADIESWFSEAPFLMPVRDFWNGVHGIIMGFKLYNQLLSFITAENVNWRKEEIELEKLTFGTVNPMIREVLKEGDEVKVVMEAYQGKEDIKKQHYEVVSNWFEQTESREEHPIIVTQKQVDGRDKLIIYDGNGRATMAVLKDKKKIWAYVGRFNSKKRLPDNYWLPTSVLMEITEGAKLAFIKKDEGLYKAYVTVIKDMINGSESGKYELQNRVLPNGTEFRKKLFEDLG